MLKLPEPPEAWVSILGEPHWRLEWIGPDGQKQTADILPGGSIEVELPVTWANPAAAWPYWPDHNITHGLFKPAGALFPFDVSGEYLCLSWEAGPDAVFYWELALLGEIALSGGQSADGKPVSGKNAVKIPANFDWPRFRRLFQSETLNGDVRLDPWLVNWRSVAEKTMSASFDSRRLTLEASERTEIPVPAGPWYGVSPFSQPLSFAEDAPVFPVRPGLNVWISAEGILRVSGKTWVFTEW
jgi:hypothetical protein